MNHKKVSLMDKIYILGELEHIRLHAVRSAHTSELPEKKFFYQVKAKQAQELRRKVQKKWADTDEKDWCLVKASSHLKQLNAEVLSEDLELFSEIEDLADSILSNALNEDLSGCESCKKDMEESNV